MSPIDHNVGGSLQWETFVYDGSNTDSVFCWGAALDRAGNLLGTTSLASTDVLGDAFVGKRQLLYSFSTSASGDYSYASECYLPGAGPERSEVKVLRVY